MSNHQKVTVTDVEAFAKFCAQCVREGVTFDAQEQGTVYVVTFLGGF